jgi:hypothetical protein
MQYKRFKLSGLGWLNNLKAEKRGRSHKQKLHEKILPDEQKHTKQGSRKYWKKELLRKV